MSKLRSRHAGVLWNADDWSGTTTRRVRSAYLQSPLRSPIHVHLLTALQLEALRLALQHDAVLAVLFEDEHRQLFVSASTHYRTESRRWNLPQWQWSTWSSSISTSRRVFTSQLLRPVQLFHRRRSDKWTCSVCRSSSGSTEWIHYNNQWRRENER